MAEIKCPHCGAVYDPDEWEFFAGTDGTDKIEVACDGCDRDFTVTQIVRVSYEVSANG